MNWLKNAFNKVKSAFVGFWKKVEPEIENTFQVFLSVFADAAFKAVSEAALKDISGAQKMKSVLTEMKVVVKNAGWAAGEAALRTLIENAYSAYKAKNGDKLVAPPNSPEEEVAKINM